MCRLGRSQDVKHGSVSLMALHMPGCLCRNSTVGGLCHCCACGITRGLLMAVVPLASPHPQPSSCQYEAGSAHRCCPHLPAGPACGQLAAVA